MTIIEKTFAIRKLNPFNRLRDSELLVIAEVAEERRYAPGEIVSSEGRILQRLYIIIEGQIRIVGDPTSDSFFFLEVSDPTSIPAVFGVESLLFDIPITDMLRASSEGAVCLSISKRHFFTTIYECPELLLGFLETSEYPEDFYQSMEQGYSA